MALRQSSAAADVMKTAPTRYFIVIYYYNYSSSDGISYVKSEINKLDQTSFFEPLGLNFMRLD
jgi:hypothetical protein